MSADRPERTLVTGLAATAANGEDTDRLWQATLAGVSGLRPVSRFDATGYPVRVAGEVPFAAADQVEGRLAVQTDRWTHLGLVTGERALADAGVVPAELPEYATAVVTGSSSGGNEFGQAEIERLWSRGPSHVGPYQSIAWFYAATTGQLSIRHGIKGVCGVAVSEQASGLDAIAQARRVVRREAQVALTGGTEAPVGPYAVACQLASDRLNPNPDPGLAYLPFDERAAGHVPGEGGAMLVLERESSAAARGATPYGEIAGHAATFAGPRPGGWALRRAVELALADAGTAPEEVDVVFADAVAVPDLDAEEAAVLEATFGRRGVPVTAPKALVGRLYAGGGSLDVAAALLSIRDGVLPPSGPSRPRPEYHLDLVTEARPARVRTALVLARGYGGFCSALVVRAP